MTQLTLEELLAALAKLPEGSKFSEALKVIIAAKEAELTQKGTQFKTLTKTLKETEEKLKKTTERLEKFYDHTGVADDVEDLETALVELKAKEEEALKNGGKAAPEISQLQKDIAKLQRDLKKATEAQVASEKTATEERSKRQTSERNRALLASLTEHKAIKPDQLLKILSDRVKVNDDDSLVYLKEDGEEIDVKTGVKGWLEANPEFVFNPQNPGAGGGGGTNGKAGDAGTFGKELAQQVTAQQTPALQKGQEFYFGKGE
jgi:chromosome segregation ATPase